MLPLIMSKYKCSMSESGPPVKQQRLSHLTQIAIISDIYFSTNIFMMIICESYS